MRYDGGVHEGLRQGARFDGTATTFTVWTTSAKEVSVLLRDPSLGSGDLSDPRSFRAEPLVALGGGWFSRELSSARPGHLYFFALDGIVRTDPFARALPFGVHGPGRIEAESEVPPLSHPPRPHEWVIYELHVGAFSPEGTFAGVEARLDHLVELGVTAIELMPVAAFAGERGWGYDGTHWFAPHAAYGEPDALRSLVRAAHARGLAVVVDAVYNHFGPSGNCLAAYASDYFLEGDETPWGAAPNFALPAMRSLVLDSARHWFSSYGVDALRVDATHAMRGPSILVDLRDLAKSLEPPRTLFFEDARNDPDVHLRLGADAVWADDFHHALHALSTGERDGEYSAYAGTLDALAETLRSGWLYAGEPYDPWGGVPRGKPFDRRIAPWGLVYSVQNHDQVGNRPLGTRRHELGDLEAYLADVMLLLFLPATPLLFMGQEWATSRPFCFFCDHEESLGEAIAAGRRRELGRWSALGPSAETMELPHPQARATFEGSKLAWGELERGPHEMVLRLHREMLHLRRTDPVFRAPCSWSDLDVRTGETRDGDGLLDIVRRTGHGERRLLRTFASRTPELTVPEGWRALVARKSAIVLGRDS